MKRIGGLIVFCFYFGTFFSQLTENFSDGDFNNNPKWTGDTLEFIVNSDFKLQLNAPSITDTSYLSVETGTLNFNDSNNIIILDGQAKTYRGLTGDDTYFVSQLLPKNVKVSITDTEGLNIIQIPSNTYVDESLFTKNAVRLTLEDGREITINGADKFTYNMGGNVTDGTAGIDLTYSDFATSFGISDVLNSSDAQTGVISDMYII